MNRGLIALAGLSLGAGIMYLTDPNEGRRRRARLRDATVHASHTLKAIAGMTSRDVEHRLTGLAARTLARLVEEETSPAHDVLAARVRARLGRLASYPGAIDVTASKGIVTVSGPIFEGEVEQLMNLQRLAHHHYRDDGQPQHDKPFGARERRDAKQPRERIDVEDRHLQSD